MRRLVANSTRILEPRAGAGADRPPVPGRAFARRRPTQRSRRIDWSIMPSTGAPRWSSAISVPNSGRPVMNDLVPSIGSSTQTNSASVRPCHAPRRGCRAAGTRPVDQLAHRRLGLAVGDGDRARVGLGLDRDRGAEIAALHSPRRSRRGDAPAPRTRGSATPAIAVGGSAARQRRRVVGQRAQIGDHVGALAVLADAGEAHLGAGHIGLGAGEEVVEVVVVPVCRLLPCSAAE